jgi:hypothetical protein
VLGDVLMLSQPLYPAYADVSTRPFGWTALQDQQAAGLVMMAEQLATLGTCVFLLLRSLAAAPLWPMLTSSKPRANTAQGMTSEFANAQW